MELKKFTRLSMLLALSVVLSMIESIIPILSGIIPGFKIGLANTVVLYVLYVYGFKDAFKISILKVFLTAILKTGLFSISFFLSLGGAILSIIAMFIFKKIFKLSIIGTSVTGSVFHCIGQILVAMYVLNLINIIYYLPIIIVLAIPNGMIVGLISKELINNIK